MATSGALSATFSQALSSADAIKQHVLSQQTAAIDRAISSQQAALTAVQGVAASAGKLTLLPIAQPNAPNFSSGAPPIAGAPTGGIVTTTAASIQGVTGGGFNFSGIGGLPDIEIAEFTPVITGLNIPDAPSPQALPSLPMAPPVRGVTLPDRPVLNKPGMPNLVDIIIPTFAFEPLAPFDEAAPEWQGSSVSGILQWAETAYEPVLMDEEIEVIRRMWAGGTGLPPAVEQAMWERAGSREDMGVARDVSAALTEFSGRGFSLPVGALVDRIDTIRTDAALRKQGLGRDIAIKVADTHIENLRFACTQALAAENVLVGLWSQMAQRQFDAAKVQMDGDLAMLNANIAIFNARQAGWSNAANVHRVALEERGQNLQFMRLELDGEIAKGTINEQRVRVFTELYKALQADIELFKAGMEGAKIESDVQRNEIENYKAQIQAVGELVVMDKNRFEGYASRVQGEVAKAQLLQAQSSAFGAYVSGKSLQAEINIKNQQAAIAAADIQLRAHLGGLEVSKANMQFQLSAFSAATEGTRASAAVFTAQAQASAAVSEVQTRQWEARIRSETAIYEVEVRKYLADLEQQIRIGGFQMEAMKAAAQAQSTLAAGAMAGISLSSSVSGGSTVNAVAQDSVNTSVKM